MCGNRNKGRDKEGMGIVPEVLVECELMMGFKRQSSQKTAKCRRRLQRQLLSPHSCNAFSETSFSLQGEKKLEEDLVHLVHAPSAIEL